MNALSTAKESNTWIIVQVIEDENMINQAISLLKKALGDKWTNFAEIKTNPPLAYGRGKDIFAIIPKNNLEEFGQCSALASPVIRYDGTISTCCNENVIMGNGPKRLRAQIKNKEDLVRILQKFSNDEIDELIRCIGMNRLLIFLH